MARELTGKHVLAITVAAFGTIIAVNLVMAFKAVGTFPGLEVANSYVASQNFDRERAAQTALGWTVTPDYQAGAQELVLTITDRQGNPVQVRDLDVVIGRPTHVRQDLHPEFRFVDGTYRAPLALEPGRWNIHVTAKAADGTAFRQRIDHYHGARVPG
ncbi:FixH family protein [Paracoccus jiaweipingae]|uniref:FixH family protein n=1 Tax=unclassified Paracoccus (in: a-proteobacteria) TaxID=2688777 RepID=UPI0037A0B322